MQGAAVSMAHVEQHVYAIQNRAVVDRHVDKVSSMYAKLVVCDTNVCIRNVIIAAALSTIGVGAKMTSLATMDASSALDPDRPFS